MIILNEILKPYKYAIISMSKCEYKEAITYYELILSFLDKNKELIKDEQEIRENINKNIEACKLLMTSF